MRKKQVLVLLCVVALVAGLTQCSSGNAQNSARDLSAPGAVSRAPKGDAFYIPPSPLPVTTPGAFIWSQALEDAPENTNAWRVLYVTTGVNDTPVATSALVYSPRDNKKHNLVAWAHPTVGVADECAPSRTEEPQELISYFDDYIESGYAIVAPDYEGLGTAGVHPYLVGSSEGRSVLDSIVMAQDFEPINAQLGTVVVGHSQGGHAALFAGELADTYAPDVKIDGIVALAPVGKLETILADAQKSMTTFGYVVMTAVGLKTAYPQVDLTKILSADVLKRASVVEEECLGQVLLGLSEDIPGSIVADPNTVDPWPQIFAENSPGTVKISAPLLIEHGLSDDTVPSSLSKEVFTLQCALGARVQRKVYSGSDATHVGVVRIGKSDALEFIEDRFAGKTFSSQC